jgi:hypothetical protein
VFNANIVRIDTQARSVTGSTDIELELDMVMIVSAELSRDTGQLLWRNPFFTVTESFASTSDTVVTSSADFAAGGISADSLAGLDSREVSRGQAQEVLDELLDEAALKLYLSAVAADF